MLQAVLNSTFHLVVTILTAVSDRSVRALVHLAVTVLSIWKRNTTRNDLSHS